MIKRFLLKSARKTGVGRRVVEATRFLFVSEDEKECPCGYRGAFEPFGLRASARCPKCGAMERQRLLNLYLRQHPLSGKVLHFAPEPSIGVEAETADIMPGRADMVLNIEQTGLPDQSYDAIICCHVLEHVDDRKALPELHRLLRPGGKAILMVPVYEGWAQTYEDDGIDSPEGRRRHFGQPDHLRLYGRDFRDRVRSFRFEVDEFTADGPSSARYGLMRGEKVFVATRPQ